MDVYIEEELDKIDDWIEKIADGNKVMETFMQIFISSRIKPKCRFLKLRSITMMLTWKFLRMIQGIN